MYIGVVITIYVSSFKSEFEQENLEKATPFLMLVSIVLIILGILSSVARRGM